MDVILRLSREMDEICMHENFQQELPVRYHKLEEDICQLQAIHFPVDPGTWGRPYLPILFIAFNRIETPGRVDA
jgi:hypothetical protein